jgi:hypothetical protein
LTACFYNRLDTTFNKSVKVKMNIMRVTRALLLAMLLGPGILCAEVVYINDVLRVGVRPEPNNSVSPINVVMTGMKLEVLDRSEGFIQIRTEQGVEKKYMRQASVLPNWNWPIYSKNTNSLLTRAARQVTRSRLLMRQMQHCSNNSTS